MIENSPRQRQIAKLKRKAESRSSYDRVLVVCEGGKTEPKYFTEIRQSRRLNTANVHIMKSRYGTSPHQVVEYAHELFESGNVHRKVKRRAFEFVYAVFDRDEHDKYHQALEAAKSINKKGLYNDEEQRVEFRAIASVPNFELWLLLHFDDITRWLNRNQVISRLEVHLPGYTKGQGGHYAQTKNAYHVAYKRAQGLTAGASAWDGNKLYTDVHYLTHRLLNLNS